MRKRILSMLLIVVMVLTMIPASSIELKVQAAETAAQLATTKVNRMQSGDFSATTGWSATTIAGKTAEVEVYPESSYISGGGTDKKCELNAYAEEIIYQTISASVGETLTLTFEYAGRNQGSTTGSTEIVFAGIFSPSVSVGKNDYNSLLANSKWKYMTLKSISGTTVAAYETNKVKVSTKGSWNTITYTYTLTADDVVNGQTRVAIGSQEPKNLGVGNIIDNVSVIGSLQEAVYVNFDTGSDSNLSGTPEYPVKTLQEACRRVKDGGTIYLLSDVNTYYNGSTIGGLNTSKTIKIVGTTYSNGTHTNTVRTLKSSNSNIKRGALRVGSANLTLEYVKLDGQNFCQCICFDGTGGKVTLGAGTSMVNPGNSSEFAGHSGKTCYVEQTGSNNTLYIANTQKIEKAGVIQYINVMRKDGFTGDMFQLTSGELKVSDTTIDGGAVYSGFGAAGYPTAVTSGAVTSPVIRVSGGTLTLGSNATLQNAAITAGGTYGAGIYMTGGTVNLESGSKIEKCLVASTGPAIYATGGAVNVNGGTIQKNTCTSSQAIVALLNSTTFNMTSGDIQHNYENWCLNTVQLAGTAKLSGGNIRYNTAGQRAWSGALITNGNSNLTISGNVQITDNTAGPDKVSKNLCVDNAANVTIGADFTGKIGITGPVDLDTQFATAASGYNIDTAGAFLNDAYPTYSAVQDGTSLKWAEGVAKNTRTGVIYDTVQKAINKAEAKDIVLLLRDITDNDLASNGMLDIEKDLTLDGANFTLRNGTISSAGHMINIAGSITFTMKNITFDSFSAVSGTCRGGIVWNRSEGNTINLENVTVKNSTFQYAANGLVGGQAATVTLKDTVYTGNNASAFTAGTMTVTLSGATTITDNGANTTTKDVNVTDASKLTIASDFTGTIGVSGKVVSGEQFATAADGYTMTNPGSFINKNDAQLSATQEANILRWINIEDAEARVLLQNTELKIWVYFETLEKAVEYYNQNRTINIPSVIELLKDVTVETTLEFQGQVWLRSDTRTTGNHFTLLRGANVTLLSLTEDSQYDSNLLAIYDLTIDGNGANYQAVQNLIKVTGSNKVTRLAVMDSTIVTNHVSANPVYNCGTIYASGAQADVLVAGKIIGNKDLYGSAVTLYTSGASLSMYPNGEISDNTTIGRDANASGAIYMGSGTYATFYGGKITNNTVQLAGNKGAAITSAGTGRITIKNAVEITGNTNTTDHCDANVYSTKPENLIVDKSFTGKVGISGITESGQQFAAAGEEYSLATAGTFINDVNKDYCAVQDGTSLKWAESVAKIQRTGEIFATVQAAIDKAVAEDTVELLKNITANHLSGLGGLSIEKTITLDGANYTLTQGTVSSSGHLIGTNQSITFTMKNLTIQSFGALNNVYRSGVIYASNSETIVLDNVKVTNNTFQYGYNNALVTSAKKNAEVTLKDVTYTGNNYNAFRAGSTNEGITVTVSGNTVITNNGTGTLKDIYVEDASKLTIASDFTGKVGISGITDHDQQFATAQEGYNIDQAGIFVNDVNVSFYAVQDKTALKWSGYVAIIVTNKAEGDKYMTLAKAIAAYTDSTNQVIRMLGDSTEADITLTQDVYVDLNGKTVTANITASNGAKLYGFDSVTNGYEDVEKVGKITGTVDCAADVTDTTSKHAGTKDMRYLKLNVDGSVEFHRFNLNVYQYRGGLTAKESKGNIDIKFFFQGDSTVAKNVKKLGFGVSANGETDFKYGYTDTTPTGSTGTSNPYFYDGSLVDITDDTDSSAYTKKFTFRAAMKVGDDEIQVEAATRSYSYLDILKLSYSKFSAGKKKDVDTFIKDKGLEDVWNQ